MNCIRFWEWTRTKTCINDVDSMDYHAQAELMPKFHYLHLANVFLIGTDIYRCSDTTFSFAILIHCFQLYGLTQIFCKTETNTENEGHRTSNISLLTCLKLHKSLVVDEY